MDDAIFLMFKIHQLSLSTFIFPAYNKQDYSILGGYMFIRYFNEEEFYRALRYSITVNVAERKMTLFKDGKVFKVYPVGVGKMVTQTPKGNFKIINKAYKPGGPFGARWLGLNKKGYGIHGTNDPSSIGKFVSHGCIRTYNNNIIELYNIVPIGTPVTIV